MSEGNGIGNNGGPSSGTEPSMEEILASIRRILTEEESERATSPGGEEPDEDILVLDSTTMVPSAPRGGPFGSEPTLDSQILKLAVLSWKLR